MYFWEGSARRGNLIIGFRERWHFIKNNGGYNENRDFFFIHYELKKPKPKKVLLHLEAPKDAVDFKLNFIKQKFSEDLISAKETLLDRDWNVEKGRLSSNKWIKRNQSSAVLSFSLPDNKNGLIGDYKKTITSLDNSVGDLIDGMAFRYKQELINLGLKEIDTFY